MAAAFRNAHRSHGSLLKIECVPIGTISANPRNPRKHSKRQIGQICTSIKQFGFTQPVLIDEANVILCGHGRWEASRQLGMAEVPVIRLDHLSAAQKHALLIADNKIAENAGWDRDRLAVVLSELAILSPTEAFDVSITGFETAEIDLLFADMASPSEQPEEISTPPLKPVSRRGDLWRLGKHHLLCGDAQLADNFKRLMNGTAIKAVFCDPPYNLPSRAIGGRGRIKHADFAFASGEMETERFGEFLSTTLFNGVQHCAEGAVNFVFIDWRSVELLINVGRAIYGDMLNLVVWNKTNAGQGSFYRSQHELIGVFRVGDASHINNIELGRFGRNRSNVWTYPGVNTFGRDRMKTLASHPTVKPVTLVADALLDCTDRGDAVLDQFAGSGTILLAAEKTGRIAYAMEYEPGYVDVAIQRWQAMTKLDATLADDGRTFDEVAAARANPEKLTEPLPSRPARKSRRASDLDWPRFASLPNFTPNTASKPRGKNGKA